VRPSGIVLVMGLSGSGKSVLAGALASRLGAVYLATDVLRRETARPRNGEAPIDGGRYGKDQRERVYGLMAEQAAAYVEAGRSVVLDGTYIEARQRAPIVELAKRLRVPLTVVECTAPDTVVRKRQEQRQKEPWTASEGRWEVYLAQKKRYEAPVELPAARRSEIDSTLPLGEQIEMAVRALPGRRR
jgi:predicted kinase